jgi:tryptophan-rich hypothetical protein
VVRTTGHATHNTIPQPNPEQSLLGSRWTSVEVYRGHRHHEVRETRGSYRKRTLHVRMENCCGETNTFWISLDEIRDKSIWRKGWVTMADIVSANGGPLRDARACFHCHGHKIIKCLECDGQGQIPSHEPLYNI